MKKNLTLYFALISFAVAFTSCSRNTGCYYSFHNQNTSFAPAFIAGKNDPDTQNEICAGETTIEDNGNIDANHKMMGLSQ